LQLVILKGLLYSMGGGEVPLLDLVAYGGYLFAGLSLAVVARLIWAYSYYVVMPWMSLCMGVFLVRTMKRVLFTEMRSSERHSSRQHYFLLFMAIAQFPLFFWLGSIGT
jgi:protein transport protein YIF1